MKVEFFYAHGTAWAANWLELGLRVSQDFGKIFWNSQQQPEGQISATIAGIGGRSALWDGQPQNDPFPSMLDPDKFNVTTINYPASQIAMGASINIGVDIVVDAINALPLGTPFALGGYSQGAAVMSAVYNELRYGTLTSRLPQFLGATMFGNPRRQQDHRGAVGGSWSGAWDVPLSSSGGHGSFPASGPYARLANCDPEWVEFTFPGDVFSSTGDSDLGANWTLGNESFLTLDIPALISYLLNADIRDDIIEAFTYAGLLNSFIDGADKEVFMTGNGHVAYPFQPPHNVFTNDTCYQVALKYLDGLADQFATAPIILPENVGWSTTLLPPAV